MNKLQKQSIRKTLKEGLRKLLLLITVLLPTIVSGDLQQSTETPSIILILTDDQRLDTLFAMPTVDKLAREGTMFTKAFVTTPVCTPVRVSILSGGKYAHKTGVLNNNDHKKFNDQDTIATTLQEKGYKTGFVGKYIHGYRPGYVPPGWTSFVANNDGGMIKDWFNLKEITFGSSEETSSTGEVLKQKKQYITHFQKDQALDFLNKYGNSPFFLLLSTYAPHSPHVPAPEHDNQFGDIEYHGRAIDEEDISDKPLWVQQHSKHPFPWNKWNESEITTKYQDYIESTVAIDGLLDSIMHKIDTLGIDDKTVIIFTSDNGLMLREHGLFDKGQAYEESIRVPLVIKMPGENPSVSDNLVAMNLDVVATIYDIADINRDSDGISLRPLLNGKSIEGRKDILIESGGYLSWWNTFGFEADGLGTWSGLRTKNWKYIEHPTGEKELYNLAADPFEKENVINDPKNILRKKQFSERLDELKRL